jgi:PAS domain S-box-containing protein
MFNPPDETLESVRKQRDLLDATLSSIGDAVITTDAVGIILFLNPIAQKLTGWTQSDACGLHISKVFKIINSKTRNVIEDPISRALKEGSITDIGNYALLIDKNGSELPIDDSAARISSPNNINEGAVLVFRDATDKRIADLAVQTSELQYRRLFQSAKDGILVLDAASLKIIDANKFISDLLGYPHDELMGKELWEFGFFKDKQASMDMYSELQTQGYVRYEHLPLETKNGKSVDVEFISNIYLVDKHAVAQCNIRDISERSIMERQLQNQTEMLADLHRRKDEFLAMLSHELRNPLAPIANAVHILRLQKDEDPLQHQARTMIERQVAQLTRLVDDLMEVARITTGRVQLRNDLVAINGVVENAIASAMPIISEREHELKVILSPEPIWLHADAARLEQVMVNLLTNAAKYTNSGGIITLSVAQEQSDCVIHLSDTGIGIAPELIPRIFDLFSQSERSLDRSRGGLGIGLALVHRLVDMHGGKVNIVSTLGKGSDFIVTLPTVSAPSRSTQSNVIPQMQSAMKELRVLVVDDNIDSADSLAMLVEMSGHQVTKAHDGPNALSIATDTNPNVVLLDIGLPILTGYEVATRIRSNPALRGMVLVAVTGYGQDTDKKMAFNSGFDHHLTKPVDFHKVQQILDDAVTTALA